VRSGSAVIKADRSRSGTRKGGPAPDRAVDEAPLTLVDTLRDLVLGVTDAACLPAGCFALSRAPRGDGHAVLVLPGFLSTDQVTWPLRWYLTQAGYLVHPWGLGYNMGLSTAHHYDIEALVEQRLKEVFIESGDRKISLVGWSLGGVYAKYLARRHPNLVRDVVTLGSPISGDTSEVSVWRIYQWVTKMEFADPEFRRRLREHNRPLEGVPITALYCRKDGVVPWRNAREKPGPLVQNIEVDATHIGMGFDAFVFYLIAHRLAKSAARTWRPLDLPALARRFQRERLPLAAGATPRRQTQKERARRWNG
jgi:pimeloyl-ACP methyl ester carboxylesterase